MAVGADGAVLVSLEGTAWGTRSAGTDATLFATASASASSFILVGAGQTFLTSMDARSWTPVSIAEYRELQGVAAGGGLIVAVGYSQFEGATILISTNGLLWGGRIEGIADPLAAVASGNGVYVVVGNDGDSGSVVLSSTNAGSWTIQPTSITNALNAAAFGGGEFVAVGDGGSIAVSPTEPTGRWLGRYLRPSGCWE